MRRHAIRFGKSDKSRSYISLLIIICILSWATVVYAQQPVSDNAVNAVAEKMYCPVCENIPLDECQTVTCIEWKEEIRNQLTNGQTEEQVIASFIARFGDNVVGTPQDPVLRALTIIAPIISIFGALFVGIYTFTRFSRNQKLKLENETDVVDNPEKSDDYYRQQLDEDLFTRR